MDEDGKDGRMDVDGCRKGWIMDGGLILDVVMQR